LQIVNILGSARKNGTSARIVRSFTETAVTHGALVTDFSLNTMQYRGCQGCEGCHTRAEHCVLLDDLTRVLELLREADIVVLSAPVYFGDTCGQFKAFYDRLWSLISLEEDGRHVSRLAPGKIVVLILSQVEPVGGHQEVVDRYTMYLELFGFEVYSIAAPDLRLAANADVSPFLLEAAALARELMRAG
jgi:multimeric flavodoxin WrbA